MTMDIDNAMAAILARYTDAEIELGGIEPTEQQWRTALTYPYEGNICLVTEFQFSADPEAAATELMGKDFLEKYSELMNKVGAKDIFNGQVVGTFTGPDETWNTLSIRQFPCRQAFIDFVSDPLIVGMKKVRGSFVTNQRTLIIKPDE